MIAWSPSKLALLLAPPLLLLCLIFNHESARLCGETFVKYFTSPAYHQDRDSTVWVLSHRRSGTHLTLDLLSAILTPPYTLVKTNHVVLTGSEGHPKVADTDELSCACLAYMRRRGRLVHAYRDVRDIVVSMYHYMSTYASPVSEANMTMDRFLENEGGIRDDVIEKWVITTSPLFYEPDIFHLRYTDSVTTMPHTLDSLAKFLGQTPRVYPNTTKNIESPSRAVQRGTGLGEHGFLSVMSEKVSNDMLRVARKIELEWRARGATACPRNADKDAKMDEGEPVWVGKKYIGKTLELPSFCPQTLRNSTVVRRIPS